MELLRLIQREAKGKRVNILLAAVVSGLSNAGILILINTATQNGANGGSNGGGLFVFILLMLLYVYCLRYTLNVTTQIFEDIVDEKRRNISDKIRKADLLTLDHIGRSRIYNVLTREATFLSEASRILSAGLQAFVMVLFASLYMILLSVTGFVVTLVIISCGIALFLYRRREVRHLLDVTSAKQVEFIESITHLLEGFKEVRMNTRRSEDLNDHIGTVSETVEDWNIRAARLENAQYLFSQYFFYILIAVLVFVLPRFLKDYNAVLGEMTSAVLFMIGPLGAIVGSMAIVAKANHAAEVIRDLEGALDTHLEAAAAASERVPPVPQDFDEIELAHVGFAYRGEHGETEFSVGPVSLTIRRGEMLFIIGGNGSGKSTLLKAMTALYPLDQGAILVDGVAVRRENAQAYRELFATIFSDFHLFDRLYGLRPVDEARVNALLERMELAKKTQYAGGRFTNLDLSSGQRKRLAFVVALLEDPPVFVFDELAADQDPHFRKYLYEEVLPDLKRQGKTVIAVTHDDRYFSVADRILKLDYGRVEFCLTPDELNRRGGF